MATGAEIPGNKINGLLSARKYATEGVVYKKNNAIPRNKFL